MSRRARTRKHHPRHAAVNAWEIAINRARSYGEFSEAFNRTANRLQQARAGNAAHGAIVVVGDMPMAEGARAA